MSPRQGTSPGSNGAASLIVFLDANSVIFLVEQPAASGPKIKELVNSLLAIGERLAVSDLVCMECQVGPLKANDQLLLAQYVMLFQ